MYATTISINHYKKYDNTLDSNLINTIALNIQELMIILNMDIFARNY